jgi:carbonic anhydrase
MDELARLKSEANALYYEVYKARLNPTEQEPAPRLLFIGCIDCRVVPELMLNAEPGDMVVLRVPGALVPPQGLGDACVGAAVELTLHNTPSIADIVVCGHTACLLINALASSVDAYRQPQLARWLAMADFIKAQASAKVDHLTDPAGYKRALLEASVRRSLGALREIDVVRSKEAAGALHLHGWFLELDTGCLWAYDAAADRFEAVSPVKAEAAAAPATQATAAPVPAAKPVPTPPPVPEVSVAPPAVAVPPAEIKAAAPPPQPPSTVAPPPVAVPSAAPVQRVYASEVSPVFPTPPAPKAQPPAARPAVQQSPAARKPAAQPRTGMVPSNVQARLKDPALDDLRALLADVQRPHRRLKLRQVLNEMRTPEGWQNFARAVNEFRDPQVRQALRELAVELNNPQSRAELRQILSQVDAQTVAAAASNLDAEQIQREFAEILDSLRGGDRKK